MILTTFVTYAASYNNTIQETHKKILNAMMELTYDEEITYMLCDSKNMDENNPYFVQVFYNLTQTRWQHFFNYIDVVRAAHLHDLITEDAFQTLADYSHWNESLYEAGMNVCKIKLHNFNEIKMTRENLTYQLMLSEKKKSYPSLLSAIKITE